MCQCLEMWSAFLCLRYRDAFLDIVQIALRSAAALVPLTDPIRSVTADGRSGSRPNPTSFGSQGVVGFRGGLIAALHGDRKPELARAVLACYRCVTAALHKLDTSLRHPGLEKELELVRNRLINEVMKTKDREAHEYVFNYYIEKKRYLHERIPVSQFLEDFLMETVNVAQRQLTDGAQPKVHEGTARNILAKFYTNRGSGPALVNASEQWEMIAYMDLQKLTAYMDEMNISAGSPLDHRVGVLDWRHILLRPCCGTTIAIGCMPGLLPHI